MGVESQFSREISALLVESRSRDQKFVICPSLRAVSESESPPGACKAESIQFDDRCPWRLLTLREDMRL